MSPTSSARLRSRTCLNRSSVFLSKGVLCGLPLSERPEPRAGALGPLWISGLGEGAPARKSGAPSDGIFTIDGFDEGFFTGLGVTIVMPLRPDLLSSGLA